MTGREILHSTDIGRIRELARQIRRDSIRMVVQAGSGHVGGPLAAAELLATLYAAVLRNPHGPAGTVPSDRFILSNGHICAGWYSVLSHFGYLQRQELSTHRRFCSRLQGHPSRRKLQDFVETSSGPLGQGLSVANGLALADRYLGVEGRIFCLMGDGELQEGQVWEATMTAAHYRIGKMCLVVSYNDVQIDGRVHEVKDVAPLGSKFAAFGWQAVEVDGHDVEALLEAFRAIPNDGEQPVAVIAHTVMGKGVPFMEGDPKWHGSAPSEEETEKALSYLGESSMFEDY